MPRTENAQTAAKDFTKARDFNLMFKTFIGPVEDESVPSIYDQKLPKGSLSILTM